MTHTNIHYQLLQENETTYTKKKLKKSYKRANISILFNYTKKTNLFVQVSRREICKKNFYKYKILAKYSSCQQSQVKGVQQITFF